MKQTDNLYMVDLFLIEISTQCEKRMSCVNGLLSAFADQFSIRMYTEHFWSRSGHWAHAFTTFWFLKRHIDRMNCTQMNLTSSYFTVDFITANAFDAVASTAHMKLDHWLLLFIAQTKKNLLQHFNFVNSTFNSRMATRNFCEIIFFYTCVFLISLFIECRRTDIRFCKKAVNKNQRTLFCERKEAQQKYLCA